MITDPERVAIIAAVDTILDALLSVNRQAPHPEIAAALERLLDLRRAVLSVRPVDRAGAVAEPEPQSDDAALLPPAAAAARLGITPGQVRRYARAGCGQRRGGRWYVDLQKIERRRA